MNTPTRALSKASPQFEIASFKTLFYAFQIFKTFLARATLVFSFARGIAFFKAYILLVQPFLCESIKIF